MNGWEEWGMKAKFAEGEINLKSSHLKMIKLMSDDECDQWFLSDIQPTLLKILSKL